MRIGKWETTRALGRGGQATAYLAIDTTKLDIDDRPQLLRWLLHTTQAMAPESVYRPSAFELLGLLERYFRRESDDCAAVVKKLHPEVASQPKAIERLQLEVTLLGRL